MRIATDCFILSICPQSNFHCTHFVFLWSRRPKALGERKVEAVYRLKKKFKKYFFNDHNNTNKQKGKRNEFTVFNFINLQNCPHIKLSNLSTKQQTFFDGTFRIICLSKTHHTVLKSKANAKVPKIAVPPMTSWGLFQKCQILQH